MSSQPPRRGLGRGLGALIPTSDPEDAEERPGDTTTPRSGAGRTVDLTPGDGEAPAAGRFTGDHPAGPGAQHPAAVWPPGSLDPDGEAAPAGAEGARQDGLAEPGARFAELPLDQLTPNPRQPRQVFDEEAMAELVHSVREVGLLQPVVVRATGPSAYELVMGERRWRACQEAGLVSVPAIVRETDDGDMLRDALLENLHRAELNPLEEASAYAQLLEDFDCTHDELARRLGRSRPQISNLLRLLRLSPAVQRRVAAGVLSAGHARALLTVADPDHQDHLAGRVVAEGISVRGLEEIVQVGEGAHRGAGGGSRARATPPADSGAEEVAVRLSDRLETRVKVDPGKRKGRITVEFATREDLHRITELIDPGGDAGMSL